MDITAFTKLVDTLNSMPSVFDSTRVAFGSPNRAGMYLVTAIASNPNYNPGVGTGVLVVKMHISGASLSWNNSETTYAASASWPIPSMPRSCAVRASAADNQSGVHYRYIGFTAAQAVCQQQRRPPRPAPTARPPISSAATTWQKSISRTVTITAD